MPVGLQVCGNFLANDRLATFRMLMRRPRGRGLATAILIGRQRHVGAPPGWAFFAERQAGAAANWQRKTSRQMHVDA